MNNTCLSHIKPLQAVKNTIWATGIPPLVEGVAKAGRSSCISLNQSLRLLSTSYPSPPFWEDCLSSQWETTAPFLLPSCAMGNRKKELFEYGKCDEVGRPGTGSMLFYNVVHQLVGHVLAGPCAGPRTIPRSPLLAKDCTKLTHVLLLVCPMPDPQWIDISC